jgi:uncharacterized protein CbrC (UPF0167 family)
MNLPVFKYHRDPIQSGSVKQSTARCRCCGEARGYIYTGPVYSEHDLDDSICPWCIAEGTAHTKFDASFVDEAALPDELRENITQEVAWRTPGYNSWQSEQWFACCNDAMRFLEPAGIREIRERYRELESTVLGNIIYDLHISGGAATRMLGSLDKEQGPTAYIFQCIHCSGYRTFVDGILDVDE